MTWPVGRAVLLALLILISGSALDRLVTGPLAAQANRAASALDCAASGRTYC